uniref:Uncharacterized protein n=1 Tax=Ailuropoda melanoleuca TaxID=9646 RepID=A0A7N5JTW9_AILME
MSLQSNALRTTGGEALKTIFLLQIGVGSCASVLLFSHNVPPILHGHEQRLFNRIPTHMALVLLSTGIPLPMAAFVFRHPLSTLGCTLQSLSWFLSPSDSPHFIFPFVLLMASLLLPMFHK